MAVFEVSLLLCSKTGYIEQQISFSVMPDVIIETMMPNDFYRLFGIDFQVDGRVFPSDGGTYKFKPKTFMDIMDFYKCLDEIKESCHLENFRSIRSEPHLFYRLYRLYCNIAKESDINNQRSIDAFLKIFNVSRVYDIHDYDSLLELFYEVIMEIGDILVHDDVEVYEGFYKEYLNGLSI